MAILPEDAVKVVEGGLLPALDLCSFIIQLEYLLLFSETLEILLCAKNESTFTFFFLYLLFTKRLIANQTENGSTGVHVLSHSPKNVYSVS